MGSGREMIITYTGRKPVEAVLLSRDGDTIRVAIDGGDDATEFRMINGTWVSDECEPARIEFAWEHSDRQPAPTAEDCCCSQELAARLVQMLYTDSSLEEDPLPAAVEAEVAAPARVARPAIAN